MACTNLHRCLNIAYSHALVPIPKNALALLLRADSVLAKAASSSAGLPQPPQNTPLKLDLPRESFSNLGDRLKLLINQYRGLVELQNLNASSNIAAQKNLASAAPLVERLHEYPAGGVDLANLVTYPPKLKPVPVKPILLDVAFNYIDYPGLQSVSVAAGAVVNGAKENVDEEAKPAKKGWFGFGR